MNQPPTFLVTPKNIETVEGIKEVLTCKVAVKPTPSITWLREIVLIYNSDPVKISHKEDGRTADSEMSIPKLIIDKECLKYKFKLQTLLEMLIN